MKPLMPSAAELKILSSRGDLKYLRGAHIKVAYHKLKSELDFTEEADNKFNLPWIDGLNRKTLTKLKALDKRNMQSVVYDNQLITSISDKYYGTTSLWHIILYVNGILHPQEITRGGVLFIPNKKDIDTILMGDKQKKSKVVVF